MSNAKEQMELAAKAYAKERNILVDLVSDLDEEILKLNRKALPAIKKAVNATKEAEAKLEELVNENPALFKKPRTMTVHGIKYGFSKQKGRIEIPDPANSIKLIRKHLASKSEVLIVSTETISKDALNNISVDELKKIGCNIIADTDAVVIKATDSDVSKLVAAFLKNDEPEVV